MSGSLSERDRRFPPRASAVTQFCCKDQMSLLALPGSGLRVRTVTGGHRWSVTVPLCLRSHGPTPKGIMQWAVKSGGVVVVVVVVPYLLPTISTQPQIHILKPKTGTQHPRQSAAADRRQTLC